MASALWPVIPVGAFKPGSLSLYKPPAFCPCLARLLAPPPAAPAICCTALAPRRNEPVYDSKGFLRLDSAGAAVRRQFCRLNGVGAKTARAWWEAGCR